MSSITCNANLLTLSTNITVNGYNVIEIAIKTGQVNYTNPTGVKMNFIWLRTDGIKYTIGPWYCVGNFNVTIIGTQPLNTIIYIDISCVNLPTAINIMTGGGAGAAAGGVVRRDHWNCAFSDPAYRCLYGFTHTQLSRTRIAVNRLSWDDQRQYAGQKTGSGEIVRESGNVQLRLC